MRKLSFLLLWLLALPLMESSRAFSQGGTIKDPLLGFSFEVAPGWQSQKAEAGYFLSSESHPGFVLILVHDSRSVADMRRDAEAGVNDGAGTQLTLVGGVQSYSANGLSAEYEGSINETAVRAHAIGLMSPHGGGVTILSGAAAEQYSSAQARVAEAVARSVKFLKPETGAVASQWNALVSGKKLTYLSSYSSGSAGGYSAKRVLSLCKAGNFSVYGNSVVSVDVPGAAGSGTGEEKGEGKWRVVVVSGQALLKLAFSDGSIKQHVLGLRDGKLTLDGDRYFMTEDPECE